MSQLREVLNRFADQSAPVSVNQLARDMKLEVGVLRGMIDYWVRKGKLREVNSGGETCMSCGIKGACPFIVALPRYYEVANDENADEIPPCSCGTGRCAV